MLDPFADKVLMTIMTVTLAYAGLLPGKDCQYFVLSFERCHSKSTYTLKMGDEVSIKA